MKVAVVGSRSFSNYALLETHLSQLTDVELLVSGGARGADRLGEEWARRHGVNTLIFKPDWKKHGKGAGFIRNRQIVGNADLVIAFWDGASRGTLHTVETARRQGVEVQLVEFL